MSSDSVDEIGQVNVDRVFEVLAGPSAVVDELVYSPNPDFQVTSRIESMPIKFGIEVLGPCAAKVHLRDRKRLISLLMSDANLQHLRADIDRALSAMEEN